MSLGAPTLPPPLVDRAGVERARRAKLNLRDARLGRGLRGLAVGGGALVFVGMIAIAFQVTDGATAAFDRYGIGFVGHSAWVPNLGVFGAWTFVYGTLVSSVGALVLSTIIGVSVGLFLALMAPRRIAAVVGPLVEMLAAIPSVVLGLIGIVLICPQLSKVEPTLHSVLGFLPLFADPQPIGNSFLAAILVLTIMVVPIIAALSRDLFLTVPIELRDGADALGATRWEMIRGVVLPTTSSGVVSACVLGFGRAIGEAIAVSQVIGNLPVTSADLFSKGDSLAAAIALQYQDPVSKLHASSLLYLGLILFVLSLVTNLVARQIGRRSGRMR